MVLAPILFSSYCRSFVMPQFSGKKKYNPTLGKKKHDLFLRKKKHDSTSEKMKHEPGNNCERFEFWLRNYLRRKKYAKKVLFALCLPIFICSVKWMIVSSGLFKWIIWTCYACTNVTSFSLYWFDKKQAKKKEMYPQSNYWRIPEYFFICSDSLGGWLGGLIAQEKYRHKTVKPRYVLRFIVIIIVHEIFWIYQIINS